MDNLEKLEHLKNKFATIQSLSAPDISWLITNLEVCYSMQDERDEDLRFTKHEVILYLNRRSGTNYRTDSTTTSRLVRARYNEGYRLEDFCKVIDTKVRQWKGDPKMQKYIRPSTLFCRGHFEEYLQESKIDGRKEAHFSERPSI